MGSLTKAYEVTISQFQDAYFAMYVFIILCEISKVSFEISHTILNPYTTKYAF